MSPDRRLAHAFLARHPRHAAGFVELSPPADGAAVLGSCGDEEIAEVLQHVDPGQAGQIIEALPGRRGPALLARLPPRRAALVLQDAPETTRETWLAELPEQLARPLRAALEQPPDSAGRAMDPAVLAAPVEMTAGHARELVARHADRALYYLYVVDGERRPVGVVNLRELMGASSRAPLSTLMHSPVVTVPTRASTAAVAAHPGWRALHALPVVDDEGALVGVLRYETGERLRERDDSQTSGGVGVALAEALWTLAAHAMDELSGAVRRKDDDHE